jgi:hypothetical protein
VADWAAHVAREAERYRDGVERLPDDPDARQRQLVRIANAACGAGLASLMEGAVSDAREWFVRAAERYRESYEHAPPASYGRPIGAIKMRLLAGDAAGARDDARWALATGTAGAESPIGRYAGCLAALVLGDDGEASRLAIGLRAEDTFPAPVATALAGLATCDGELYRRGLEETLVSFEERDEYLEDVPVADTVLVLEELARPRGLVAGPRSAVLPEIGKD